MVQGVVQIRIPPILVTRHRRQNPPCSKTLCAWPRYELEKELVEGTVAVEQLPALWKERMTAYLGCTPADDAQGVLQDVHWSAGLFGYFPTYTLGAMFACQIYQARSS